MFPCGTTALDFVGTLQARRGQTPDERIGTPGRLDTWFVQSGLLDEEPGSDAADLRAALDLREAIYSLARSRIDGGPLPSWAVTVVNRQAAGSPVVTCLCPGGETSRYGLPGPDRSRPRGCRGLRGRGVGPVA
ncbi:ABATE domain-containing protein [Streptomyces sp. NPDC005969]|uniref:ABATE domain-containing protein n=1 Tax=Streptomyces sp. NPDC005969 TaxID=3156722 RepID=UPI00340874A4